jgi:hypothetical protein
MGAESVRTNEAVQTSRVVIAKGNLCWTELMIGPLFSGKSQELIRQVRRAGIARQRAQSSKPRID